MAVGPRDDRSSIIPDQLRDALAAGDNPDRGFTFHSTRGSLSIDRKGFTIIPDADAPPESFIPGVLTGHPAGSKRPTPLETDSPHQNHFFFGQ